MECSADVTMKETEKLENRVFVDLACGLRFDKNLLKRGLVRKKRYFCTLNNTQNSLMMKIDFKDTKGVEVKGFNLTETYADYLEGSKQTVTASVLQNIKREKGKLYIQPELVEDALKPYVFRLEVWYKWEYRMEVIWCDYDIPSDISFFDYLQQKVKEIEFEPNCKYVDLDEFIDNY